MPKSRKNLNYRPISQLELLMRQTLEGMEDFASNFGFKQSVADFDFELLDIHAVEALPTRTISQPFTARILHFPEPA